MTRTAAPPTVAAASPPTPQGQDAQTGTVGVYTNSTATATKTNTPILNIPQSLNVVTKDQIKDQSYGSLTDVTRYIPGVAVHQGEGNRDELVIRGVDSSANFFVNGFRDDVQIYRDLYNTQSVEVLRGPSALTFGRGAGGGLLNRTLKEADGQRILEASTQFGSYNDRRVSLDAGNALTDNVAARLNMFYEKSDTFRDFTNLERFGFNPTVTFKPDDATKIKLSYEHYHDDRIADRGNPSWANGVIPSPPFAPAGNLSTFYGSPYYNKAKANVDSVMASIDHDFGNGLTVRNATIFADYHKFYQNVYPGGAVNAAATSVNLSAYQHWTNRRNLINQTDFTYKVATGPVFHTLAFGAEFGRQEGIDARNTGTFGGGATTVAVNPFAPTYFGPVIFQHLSTDGNSKYRLNTESAYVRDTVDVTKWLQLIGGVRVDRFDLSALDQNTNTLRSRVDTKLSPQAAAILKPWDNVSVYTAYSVSYLPASGDQFSSLNSTNLILDPQKFENVELGAKWNINPRLLASAAIYNLNRTNVPFPIGGGISVPSGAQRIQGFEASLTGFVTGDWQASLGYAYTDARVTSKSSPTIVPGNRVQLVPYNQVSLWNKYQFNPWVSAALGVIYFSDSFAASDDQVKLPGFVRVDTGLYFKVTDNVKAQLNVENLFNKGYWASADGNNNISPGQGRTVRVSLTAKF
ncbi:TonB-dependent siderophore receptor [Roseiarcaceae bacterium H3SJ34-1]|nr:TonB-dependent siderophore receptor [Roseiarcaceae bacterium H3SJ34-1]